MLVIDTGDRIEGNGLFDASDPKGKYTYDIFKEQEIDLLCSGNHELYKKNSSENDYLKTVPSFHGAYLASNIDIFDPKSGERVPLAPRFRKFTTKNQGIRVLAFGFLFDFTGNKNNTVVQPVSKTIREQWFQKAIRDREVDLFLVAGHVPLQSEEFKAIHKAIREVQWDVPIQFFGGHTHIRDYAKFDSKAYALESGRYMETIGFMSLSGLERGGKYKGEIKELRSRSEPRLKRSSLKFGRRYIDNNLFSFYHHTSLNSTSFPTSHGLNVSRMIDSARSALGLDRRFGCAPRNLWTHRAPYPSNQSIFSWLEEQVFPSKISDSNRGNNPTILLVNTGALRFDIYEGAITVDTKYTVSPFTSGFRFIKDVPFDIAEKLLTILNSEVPQLIDSGNWLQSKIPISSSQHAVEFKSESPGLETLFHKNQINQAPLKGEDPELTPGYTTVDDAGSDGDDTIHSPIKFYRVPNCIESRINFPSSETKLKNRAKVLQETRDPEVVDLVYVDFIQAYVLLALKFLGTDYQKEDTGVYMEGMSMTAVIFDWVKENWEGKC